MRAATVTNINQGKREMPSENGYVSLWRDINKQAWSKNVFYYGVFTKLLTMVQYKDYSTTYKNVDVDLKSGEFVTCYSDIMNMFNEFTDKDHAKRIVKKFKSLGQIYTRELKDGKVNIGFILGFKGWNKWQIQTPPPTTPLTPPESANLKALEGGKTTPKTTPQTTHINNNVFNNLKRDAGFDNQRISFLELRENAFNHFWQTWSDAKKLLGAKNTATKSKTKTKFLGMFPDSMVNRLGEKCFNDEINDLCKLAWIAHSDIAEKDSTGQQSDWFNHRNMWPDKFLSNKQWRESEWKI